jgi:hypothetical protein
MSDLRKVTTNLSRPLMEMIVFPIIKALFYPDGREVHKLIGTGFFLDSDGLFFTARHVFSGRESAFDLEGAADFAVYCVHAVDLHRKLVARHIDVSSVKTHSHTDIAAGRVEMNQFGRGDKSITQRDLRETAYVSQATADNIPVGTGVFTVAYPRAVVTYDPGSVAIHFQSDAFSGRITKHYPEGRDRSMIPWPCYETDMEIMSGASGGPVFVSRSGGVLFGVNCTGTTPHSVSYVAALGPLAAKPTAALRTLE